jgi:ribonuclease Z
VALQFDAGRGTVMRLTDLGVAAHRLSAVFLTHVHSDHLVGLADVAMTRWIQQTLHPSGPLTVVAPDGAAATFARRMLDAYADDIAVRMAHVQPNPPGVDVVAFATPTEPTTVWRTHDGTITVEAVAVHHEPVEDAVAYRVTTPAGVVVVSGDTRVCGEVEALSTGADVLVHEACRTAAMQASIAGTPFERIFDYHADTVALGGLAARAGVGHLVLTHLIPAPTTSAHEAAFEHDVRAGGYDGPLTVGHDLLTIEL